MECSCPTAGWRTRARSARVLLRRGGSPVQPCGVPVAGSCSGELELLSQWGSGARNPEERAWVIWVCGVRVRTGGWGPQPAAYGHRRRQMRGKQAC